MAINQIDALSTAALPYFELHLDKTGISRLESELESADGMDKIRITVSLAWYLRQIDSLRAISLADQAELLLAANPEVSERERRLLTARLNLLRAESAWLQADLDTAESLLASVMVVFSDLEDRVAQGDCYWLEGFLGSDRGKSLGCEESLKKASIIWEAAGDSVRTAAARARYVFFHAFQNPVDSAAILERDYAVDPDYHPVAAGWLQSARASVSNMQGNLGKAASFYIEAFRFFLDFGQIRSAIISANNCAVCFEELGDATSALDWSERGLELAMRVSWPGMLGICRTRTGNVLRLLGRFEAAEVELKSGLAIMARLANSHNYAVTLRFLGDLAFDTGDYATALDWNIRLEQLATNQQDVDLLIPALRGQSKAYAGLNRPQDALAKVNQALQLAGANGNTAEEVKILHIIASLHRDYVLPLPETLNAVSTELHFLENALAIAAGIDGYSVPANLLADVAGAHAAVGDYKSAYQFSLRAADERNKAERAEAEKRAVALQIRNETERARAEAMYQRQLAETEGRRARSLQETAGTLETLGQIGRDLTANLDAQAVFLTLQRHVQDLLDTNSFFIYLVDDSLEHFAGVFAIENDQPIELPELSACDSDSNVVRCARERREIAIDLEPQAGLETHIPGTLDTLSLLYAPLSIGSRLLGVMSIQTLKPHAYGERETSIFHTLCAYTAIALDNALAYRELEEANDNIQRNREQLLAAEKMASLGRLTAGIAHEINTPLATVRTSLDELTLLVDEYDKSIDDERVAQADHHAIASDMGRALNLAIRAGNRVATFIRSIKTQTREPSQQDRVVFDVINASEDALSLLAHYMRPKAVDVVLSGHDQPTMIQGAPGKFAQIVTNLMVNAVDALPAAGGRIELAFSTIDSNVVMTVGDNGSGIDPAVRSKIFDPLFTTKKFGESTGLGLTIVRDIVTGGFNGTIDFQSNPGQGTIFTVCLPLAGVEQPASL